MTTIKLKNGSGAPTAGDLAQGEPALDLTNKRLYTEDSGGTVIEVGTNPGTDVTFADNRKAIFGAGSDLQIYHDGSDSYIKDNGDGDLIIQAYDDIKFQQSTDNADLLTINTGGNITVHSGNIDVNGTVTADGLTVDGATDGTAVALFRADNNGVTKKNTLRFEDTDTTTQNDQQIGRIEFYSNDTDHTGVDAVIEAVSATTGLKELRFLTSDTANTPLSRLAINKSGDISFYEDTGTTAKLFWDASTEGLGLGTTSPATGYRLDILGNSGYDDIMRITGVGTNIGPRINLTPTGTGINRINATANSLQLQTGGTAAVTIDSSQNVGIGTSSPATQLHVIGETRIDPSSGNARLRFSTSGTERAQIFAESGANLGFETGGTERMRIDSSGNLLVGATSFDSSNTGHAFSSAGGSAYHTRSGATVLFLNRLASTGTIVEFQQANTAVGTISVTSSATAYNTSSDQRLKDNIVDAPSASDDIDAIQVRSFDWKADGSHQKYGMVAQELQSVAPEAVTGDADSEDMMGVDYSKLVPMMLKEIQSLRARVAQLEGEN